MSPVSAFRPLNGSETIMGPNLQKPHSRHENDIQTNGGNVNDLGLESTCLLQLKSGSSLRPFPDSGIYASLRRATPYERVFHAGA